MEIELFQNADLVDSLPHAAKLFSNITKVWARLMKHAGDNSNVLALCGAGSMVIEQALPYAEVELNKCLKTTKSYLLKKRLEFPQLFFLSDTSILHLMTLNMDALSMPELSMIFDGMKTINIDETEEKQGNAFLIESVTSKNNEITLK